MNKIWVALILSLTISFNVYAATLTEKKLLASWGVELKESGNVEYINKQTNKPIHWTFKPLPNAAYIDYSRMPVSYKPLVIYNQ